MRARRGVLIALALPALLILVAAWPEFYTEWLWFESVGYLSVFRTRLTAQFGLFLLAGLVTFALIGLNLVLARRLTSSPFAVYLRSGRSRQVIELADRATTFAIWLAAGLLGLVFGLVAAARWSLFLRFASAVPFGVSDPVFGQDVGFYVFALPVYRTLINGLLWTLGLALIGAALVYGGGQLRAELRVYSPRALMHLSVLGALWLLVKSADYLVQRYELLYTARAAAAGPGFTDITVRLPALTILAVVVGAAAVLLLAAGWSRRAGFAWTGLGLWLVTLVLANLVPPLVQQFQVRPNELVLERPYIERAIAGTRAAYNLDAIQEFQYSGQGTLSAAALEEHQATLSNVRVWDYRPLLATYAQLQEIRPYYDFYDVDVAAYTLEGQLRGLMLSAREMNVEQLNEEARTWVNQHLVYTHGYGYVANPVNQVGAEGLPVFLVKDIPPQSSVPELAVTRPEIYYGEETTNYVIVNTQTEEFDYPMGEENVYTRFQGSSGVPLSSFWRRLAFFIRFGSSPILLSPSITPESRILFHRQITDRVQTVAPFLRYDPDPYLAVADGKLYWIYDAYTFTARYPYSEFYDEDTNYIRNAVKITIDAYDGTTRFYIADPTDPLIRTWARVFPDLFRPLEEMPRSLAERIRYPEGLFRIQAYMFGTFHMRDPQVFYNKEDLWTLAYELHGSQRQQIEPYYVVMRLPDRSTPEFLLIVPYTPMNRDNMIAWLYAHSGGPDYGQLGVYKFSKQELVYGPMQIESRINQDPTISAQLTLWDQRGSQVIGGNLLVIPIDNALIYVKPIFLQAETSRLPELQRVIVAYRDHIVMETSLRAGLERIFGIATGPPPTPEPGPTPAANDIAALARSAQAHYDRAQECLRAGDWACYGAEQAALQRDLEALVAATEK